MANLGKKVLEAVMAKLPKESMEVIMGKISNLINMFQTGWNHQLNYVSW